MGLAAHAGAECDSQDQQRGKPNGAEEGGRALVILNGSHNFHFTLYGRSKRDRGRSKRDREKK
jgi:hypothetical protein